LRIPKGDRQAYFKTIEITTKQVEKLKEAYPKEVKAIDKLKKTVKLIRLEQGRNY